MKIKIICLLLSACLIGYVQAMQVEPTEPAPSEETPSKPTYRSDSTAREKESGIVAEEWEDDDEDDDKKRSRTNSFINLDFGLNNYLTPDNEFPDANNELYTVKPFGSWYLGLSSVQRTKVAGPLYMEWGGGLSWYNFKWQDASARLTKDDMGVSFFQDQNDFEQYTKSKLSVTYLNVFLVPVLHFGGEKGTYYKSEDDKGLRIGFGPYAGYRLGSKTKFVYEEGGKQKNKNRDNYYLSNFRYGVRAQVGWKGVDLFMNYDMNELFEEGRGPELHPISFGIVF